MALIPPFFLDCIVAVGFPSETGEPRYAATGFLYGQFMEQASPDKKTYQVFFVTNRHVVEDAKTAYLRFNPEGNEPARDYTLDLYDQDNAPLWFAHPNPNIDIAVVRINVQLLRDHGISFSWFQSDQHVATRLRAADLGITEGDGVYILGFPMGLIGETRNFAIVRQGAIARVRDCIAASANEFLVDCTIFPGNSGGPVVTRPEAVAIEGTSSVQAAYLIGVVASYVPYQDVAVSTQT